VDERNYSAEGTELPLPSWLGIAAALVMAMLSVTALALYFSGPHPADPVEAANSASFIFAPLVFGPLGALLVHRRPGNVIGWIFIGAAAALLLSSFPQAYATVAFAANPRLPLAELAFVVGGTSWPLNQVFTFLLFLLFPTGRLPSPRWRPVAVLVVMCPLLLSVATLFYPDSPADMPGARSPFALAGQGADAYRALVPMLVGTLFLLPFLMAVAALVVRFRRSRGVERQQLKWLTFGAIVIVLAQVVSASGVLGSAGDLATGISYVSIPIAIAIAVLRYRLYDIDVLIKRTVVYGATSAAIATTFFLGIVALQAILRPLTSGSELAVAASTLVSFALFQPIRRRVQDAVDRRFDRSRYDAARTVEAFTDQLRDEVDLAALRAELLRVVGETMQPAHASLWLRSFAR
jgi:hypothetical protein